MKKKLESLHGEVKSFRKVAEARLEEVFFTHPEYRKLNTASAVNWMIDRINTLNYPFSTKNKTMVSVWKQVLSEKREEMIAGIKKEPDKVNTEQAAEFDQALLKRMMKEKGISVTQAAEATGLSPASIYIYRTGKNLKNKVVTPGVRKLLEYIESQPIKEPKTKKTDKTAGQGIAAKSQGDDQGNPRLGVSRKLQAIPPPLSHISVKVFIERLRRDIKAERAASKIARKLKLSPSYINLILKENASDKMKRRLPQIAEVFSQISKNHCQYSKVRSLPTWGLPAALRPILGGDIDLPQPQAIPPSPLLFPASQVSDLRIEIDKNKLCLHLTIDIAGAVRKYSERRAMLNDEIKTTID